MILCLFTFRICKSNKFFYFRVRGGQKPLKKRGDNRKALRVGNLNQINMAVVNCPKCSEFATKGGYHTWQIIVAVCFFPIGLLALLAEKEPNKCLKCGFIWQG